MPKNVQTTTQLYSFYMLVRYWSKPFKLGFKSTQAKDFQMYKLDLEKAEEPEIKLPTSVRSYKKEENSRKISTTASLTMLKPWIVWITANCGKFFMRWEYQTTLPASWETWMQVKKQQLEPDMEQWFKIEKGVRQGCILSPCLFNLYARYTMQNAGLDEAQLESRLPGEISINSDM